MNAEQLRETVDLHDLAHRLNIQRHPGGNYHAPWRPDRKASLSVFNENRKWRDHGSNSGGSCIDLVMQIQGLNASEAMRYLHELYGFPMESTPKTAAPPKAESKAEYIWRTAKKNAGIVQAAKYLTDVRKLPAEQVAKWQDKVFGFSNWTPKDGNPDAHGPATIFPVVNQDGVVSAVNMRYLADGHDPKMRTIGEPSGCFFLPDLSIKRSSVIWLVESPIDALTLVAAGCPAMAFLSASMAKAFPLSWLNDKQRLMILADGDEAGKGAAETLYHRAISAGITAQIVDWSGDHKDPNAALQAGTTLETIQSWAKNVKTDLFPVGGPWIPEGEFGRMRSFICNLDTTEFRTENDGGEKLEPVASYRIFRMDPIMVHDPTTALTGKKSGYSSHQTLITYRRSDSPFMQKQIIDGDDVGKPTTWQKFGHLHNPRQMARILQTLGRDQRHTQETVGVIGLVYVGGQLQLVDSKNSYLTDEQCIYHRLVMPSAPQETASGIMQNMDGLFKNSLGLIALAWTLGSMMKVFLGFWPHLVVRAHHGSGKSVLVEDILSILTGCVHKEPSEIETRYRRMKMLSNHIYPVFLDEISRAKKADCNDFVDLLNSSYRAALRNHGTSGQYLMAAPVCLIGQDNPVEDSAFSTKIIQFSIDDMKIESGLFAPREPFPVAEWAQWLIARWDREKAETRLKMHTESLTHQLKRDASDNNIGRFITNYAALQFAIEELFAFSGYKNDIVWGVIRDIMNRHLGESVIIRRESVAILEQLVQETNLAKRREDQINHKVENGFLILHTNTILPYLHKLGHEFPVTSSVCLADHLERDGFLVGRNVSRNINGKKGKCVVISLQRLEDAGIVWPTEGEPDPEESS